MPILRLFFPVLLVLASACTTALPAEPAPAFYVVRHLNTPEGQRDPDLAAEGRRVAALLAGWFGEAPPQAIYVSHYRRARQTAAPLAARLGLTPIVYDPADTPGLVARVRAGPLPALVVGHSNTVPDVVAALGGTRPGPLVHADFGDIWVIGAAGETERLRIETP
jgi:broad specificity phosphatase PhoE